MIDDAKDGGQAFPTPEVNEYGMSMRDWFAGQALAGWPGVGARTNFSCEALAKDCYRIADAMLEARKLPTSKSGA